MSDKPSNQTPAKTPVAQAVAIEYHLVGATSYAVLHPEFRRPWKVGEKYVATASQWAWLQRQHTESDPPVRLFLPWGEVLQTAVERAQHTAQTGKISIHHDGSDDVSELEEAGLEVTDMQTLLNEDSSQRSVDLTDLENDDAEVSLRGGTPGHITTTHTETESDGDDAEEVGSEEGEQDQGQQGDIDTGNPEGEGTEPSAPKAVSKSTAPRRVSMVKKPGTPVTPKAPDPAQSEKVEI